MSQDEKLQLQYFVAEKPPVLIVTFVGDMVFSTTTILSKCRTDIGALADFKFVILNFRDVEMVSGDAISVLTQMQIDVRSRGCELRLVSLKPDIKQKLLNMGTIRKPELANNMRDALLSLTGAQVANGAARRVA